MYVSIRRRSWTKEQRERMEHGARGGGLGDVMIFEDDGDNDDVAIDPYNTLHLVQM